MTASRDPDRDLFSELADRAQAPDMTRSIMARLGYMRVPDAVARRRRRRGRLLRLASVAVAFVLLGVGMSLHEIGPRARRPVGPTIHSALRNDVSRTQQHLDNAFRTIRKLGTRLTPDRVGPASVEPEPVEPQPPAPVAAPVAAPAVAPTKPAVPSGGVLPELIDGDAELWDLGPMRWL